MYARRHPRRLALGLGAVTALVLATPAPAIAGTPKPGRVGAPIVLEDTSEFSGYDIGMDSTGTAYVGWISDFVSGGVGRTVHLCTLPPGATACAGGVQTVDAGGSYASGLRVLVTPGGLVSLVWFHDDQPAAIDGPRGGRIAVVTSQSGGPLSAVTDVADAPSNGTLYDAEFGPDGSIWTVAEGDTSSNTDLEIRPGVANPPVTLSTPVVGFAELAFSGSTPILVVQDVTVTNPPLYSTATNGVWSPLTAVPKTWGIGYRVGLVKTRTGVRLITSTNDASYYPVVSKFSGTSFGKPTFTGDYGNCDTSDHDLATDNSGRIADVQAECGENIVITNLPDTLHSGRVSFDAGNTTAGGPPRIATTPRGLGWVAYSAESHTAGNELFVAPILLPGVATSKSAKDFAGSVSVSGPISCLPPVGLPVTVSAKAAKHWKLVKKSLALGSGPLGKTLDGSKLKAGKSYTINGTATFAKVGTTETKKLTVKLSFSSCPNS